MTSLTLLSQVLFLCACLSALSALPLSSTENKAKRSSEVILYENQQKSTNVNKRSEGWPIVSSNEKPYQQPQNVLGLETPAETEGDKAVSMLTEDAVKDIEEKAFYEAVEFVVDKLVDQAYDDGYVTDDLFDSTVLDSSDIPDSNDIPPQSADTEREMEDQEANQLASLIQQAKLSSNEKSDIELRADNSEQVEISESDQSESSTSEEEEEEEEETVSESTMKATPLDVFADYENFGLDDNYEYNFSNLLDYLDYLDMLKTVEAKLKAELKQETSNLDQKEKTKSAKSRKKRSLETSLQLSDEFGSTSDRLSDSSRMDYGTGNGGLCFTAEEVAELKALLVQLAKEKIESEDLISYLLGTEGYEDMYEEGDDYDSRIRGDYYQQNKNSLYKLGSQMNRADKRAPLYMANQWPYYRK